MSQRQKHEKCNAASKNQRSVPLSPLTLNSFTCHICGSSTLDLHEKSRTYFRVTSDCKPWRKGGALGTCQQCQTVQAIITPEWRADAQQIYKDYEVYHQGGGIEQSVFSASGESDSRSNQLVARLSDELNLPAKGNLLDIGCGNGTFLQAFGASFPGWTLSGAEFDAKHRSDLAAIPTFQQLYTGSLDQISERFDLIALVHTLEHIEGPVAFLQSVSRLLAPDGILFIQVPHYRENPFELMTADHASHFDSASLESVLLRAGFSPQLISTEWVGKELSAVAGEAKVGQSTSSISYFSFSISQNLDWLGALLERSRFVQSSSLNFGLFGSSIAATWTVTNLPLLPDFFVDEDPARSGRLHLSRPILNPRDIPVGSDVFVALQPELSRRVMDRLASSSLGRWQRLPD